MTVRRPQRVRATRSAGRVCARAAPLVLVLVLAGVFVGGIAPAGAAPAPATQVVEGSVLRLVSEADWEAASRLRPGDPVRWDVTVSAEAPDPGVVHIGISATGAAALLVAAERCSRAWSDDGCPGEASVLRGDLPVPRDGAEVPLVEMGDTEVAHLRLTVTLESGGRGSTEVRVHATGAGETAVIGPDGGLAATGVSPGPPWLLGVLAVLIGGGLLLARRRKNSAVDSIRGDRSTVPHGGEDA